MGHNRCVVPHLLTCLVLRPVCAIFKQTLVGSWGASLKTGLPHLLITSLTPTSDQVRRWCRPNFQPAPTLDHKISFIIFFISKNFKCKHKFYCFKFIFFIAKITNYTNSTTLKNTFTSNIRNLLHVF